MRLDLAIGAEPRESRGKNEARRTRKAGRIPAVIYGAFQESQAVSVDPKDILRIIRSKTGHNSIFDLDITGLGKTPVIVADEQYDPIKGSLLHVDLKRIDVNKKIKVSIPVRLSGEAKGVKQAGGILDFVTRRVEIECLPDAIPDEFVVDVTEFGMGSAFRVSDLQTKEGTRVITPQDSVVAHVVGVKEEVTEAAAAPATGEPEVVKKGKKEEAAPAAPAAADKGKKK